MPEPISEGDKTISLLVGGPGLCLVCGRTFTRGGAFDLFELMRTPNICQWCIAGWLAEITGWAIVDQMRGWLVTRDRFKRADFAPFHPEGDDYHPEACDDTT